MNKIKINSAESVIEAYYDGGESYDGHEKYSVLPEYRVEIPADVNATVKQGWCCVDTVIYSGTGKVIMERDCDLDATGFDAVTLSATARNTRISIILTTELGEETVLQEYTPDYREFGGKFRGKHIRKLRYEIQLNDPAETGDLSMWFLLLVRSDRLAQEAESGYEFDPSWPGCFREDYEFGPEIGIYVRQDEMDALREKIQKPPFDKIYAGLKKAAYAMLGTEPEKGITEYLLNNSYLLCRPGHLRTSMVEGLQNLSFVAMMEQDRELARLAGRILLSVAVTPHWCESMLGNLPGAAWHHRAFLEGLACKRCAIALDFIGSSLTWHGKNLVYDAIMKKGLPQVESDMFSIEYIRHCNQGVVFNDDRIFAYIALAHRYPRYAQMIDIAEADAEDMINKNIEPDGGSLEGPSYWSYTIDNVVEAAMVLAHYRKKSLRDYASDRLKKMGDYVLALLSRTSDGNRYMLVNDCYSRNGFGTYVLSFLYQVTGNPFFGATVRQQLEAGGGLETLMLVGDMPQETDTTLPLGMVSLNESGFTTLRQKAGDKTVQLHITAGKAYFSHYHEDKGQLLLTAGDEELLCDRGNAGLMSKKPISHNLFVPVREGMPYAQLANECASRVVHARYENGVFDYKADLCGAWEPGIFESLTREISSQKAGEYLVTDRAQCVDETAMSLRFHSIYPITQQDGCFIINAPKSRLVITPVDYAGENYTIREDDKLVTGEPVWQLAIDFAAAKSHKATTRLTVLHR